MGIQLEATRKKNTFATPIIAADIGRKDRATESAEASLFRIA